MIQTLQKYNAKWQHLVRRERIALLFSVSDPVQQFFEKMTFIHAAFDEEDDSYVVQFRVDEKVYYIYETEFDISLTLLDDEELDVFEGLLAKLNLAAMCTEVRDEEANMIADALLPHYRGVAIVDTLVKEGYVYFVLSNGELISTSSIIAADETKKVNG
jgi:ribosomal protein S18 acetylase RimI-like enzyme